MKNYHKWTFIFLMSLIMSCDFGKNKSPDSSTSGRTTPQNKELTNTTNYKSTGNFEDLDTVSGGIDKVADSLSENWNLDNPKRKEHLYATFDMTEDQIQKYEDALQNWKESDKEDAFKLLSANAKIKEEDRILKAILDDSQYKRYKKWARANDLRR